MTLHQDTSFCATLRHSQECILTYRHPVHHSKRKYVLSSFAKVGITSILTHTHAHLRILTHTHMHKKVHILAVCTAAASFALLRSVTVGNIKTHRHVLMHTFTTSTHYHTHLVQPACTYTHTYNIHARTHLVQPACTYTHTANTHTHLVQSAQQIVALRGSVQLASVVHHSKVHRHLSEQLV
jgi:hypothetical protein